MQFSRELTLSSVAGQSRCQGEGGQARETRNLVRSSFSPGGEQEPLTLSQLDDTCSNIPHDIGLKNRSGFALRALSHIPAFDCEPLESHDSVGRGTLRRP